MRMPVLVATVLVVTLVPHPAPAGRSQVQRDLDAVVAAGVTGAAAEVHTARGRETARAGVAALGSGRPTPGQPGTAGVPGQPGGTGVPGRPVAPGSSVRYGSITKTYVAATVLSLVGEGRVRLDDTVERWLPGVVAGGGNDGSRITVRQLLGQTSGLYDYTWDLFADIDTPEEFRRNRWRDLSAQRRVAIAMTHPPAFAPGTAWAYSNTNYTLAGMVIEAVTGERWEEEVRRRILRPLGLGRTRTPDVGTTLARPHPTLYQRFAVEGEWVDATDAPLLESGADGSITGPLDELTRFLRALVTGRLLAAPELAAMRSTVDAGDGTRYGLGLRWTPLPCGGGYWTHGGNGIGYTTLAGATTGGRAVSVAVFSRTVDPDATDRQDRAMRTLIDNALCG